MQILRFSPIMEAVVQKTSVKAAMIVVTGFLMIISTSAMPANSDEKILSRTKRWEEFPNATFTFDCTGRSIGFYADLEFDCQIFHMCDAQGRRIPYMCDKNTAFNQRFRICDWAFNVNCDEAPDWYFLNDLTYREDSPREKRQNNHSSNNRRKSNNNSRRRNRNSNRVVVNNLNEIFGNNDNNNNNAQEGLVVDQE